MARFDETFVSQLVGRHFVMGPRKTYHALALLNIDLVAEHDLLVVSLALGPLRSAAAYEGEALRVHRAGLDEELVSPAVKGIETLGVVDVVDEYTAVCTTVEGNTKRLESLLAGGVPELSL